MTLSEIRKRLADAGIENAAGEAEILIEAFTGVTRAHILANGRDADYGDERLTAAVEKRCERYPLQYILGWWEFAGLRFTVNENVLIPRPDTEVTAEAAIKAMPKGGRLLDLCTGSGCIAAAVLAYTENTSGCAVELYPKTAHAAQKNLEALGLADRCRVIIGDAAKDLFAPGEKFDVITANPPYITADEMCELEPELSHEPRAALTDEGDGLSLIRAIIRIYRNHLTEAGCMIIEHGWRQSEAVCGIAKHYGMESAVLKDYGGRERGVILRVK